MKLVIEISDKMVEGFCITCLIAGLCVLFIKGCNSADNEKPKNEIKIEEKKK